ncbi:hypothetical protein [Ruegeria halocynthiae]|uniref:hypothetical protein n=1 Tax=Ruegeria halocynthiae TaxID=985054 RepID=UPI0005691FAD|nr:hypothetical protein [Ruegeria halocynthiae]
MNEISQQLLYQRLRNRIIEQLDHSSSLCSVSELGAFETLECIYDFLPIDFDVVPELFDEEERKAISGFLEIADKAAKETHQDTWELAVYERSTTWVELSRRAKLGYAVFLRRGRFSEDEEANLTKSMST